MPVTGIFFLPPSTYIQTNEVPPLQLLYYRLTTLYNLTPLPRWTLEHRLFRGSPLVSEQAISDDKPTKEFGKLPSTRYLQIVSISSQPSRSYVAISTSFSPAQTQAGTPASTGGGTESNVEPARIIAIPSGSQSEDPTQLIVARFAPLWTQRSLLHVSNGQAFEVDNFRIKIGELKQGQGGAQQSKGIFAEVEWVAGDANDWDSAEAVLKAFWSRLDIPGAREHIRVPGVEDRFGNIRQWCEMLRLRL